MYLPRHFEPPDREVMLALLAERPLATLVIQSAGGLLANHIPLQFVAGQGEGGVLRGHVARANPLWQHAVGGVPALAVFSGPDHYVSPGWYPAKAEHGRVVPTWNYCVVHAHGTLRAVDDSQWLRSMLEELTRSHEAAMPHPWGIDDAPPDYIERMLAAVVGIELVIERLEGKWKLSQNQTQGNRAGVVEGLAALGGADAGAMRAAMLEESR